jgi:hypothetical protein
MFTPIPLDTNQNHFKPTGPGNPYNPGESAGKGDFVIVQLGQGDYLYATVDSCAVYATQKNEPLYDVTTMDGTCLHRVNMRRLTKRIPYQVPFYPVLIGYLSNYASGDRVLAQISKDIWVHANIEPQVLRNDGFLDVVTQDGIQMRLHESLLSPAPVYHEVEYSSDEENKIGVPVNTGSI